MTENNNNNVPIGVEQICAAILNKLGKVELSVEELLTDYSSKNVAVNQDPDTNILTFELAEAQTENE